MSTFSLLESIKSRFITNRIFSLLEYKQKLELLKYSKILKRILNLSLYNYQEIYIKNKNINLYDYLNNSKDISENNLHEILTKYHIDENAIQKYCVNYFRDVSNNNMKKRFIEQKKELINIYSPFLYSLLNTDYFSRIFEIVIDIGDILEEIFENKLEDDYNSFFIKLNEYNSKQLSFYIRFGIDNETNFKNNFLYKNLFSSQNIINNLVSLRLYGFREFSPDEFSFLNKLKNLTYLQLRNIYFKSDFILELYDLTTLILNSCKKISLGNKKWNLKFLSLELSSIISEAIDELPELEELYIGDNIEDSISIKNFPKLKYFYGKNTDFIKINKNSLETIILYNQESSKEEDKIKIEKILAIKTLKYLDFSLENFTVEEFSQFPGQIDSLKEIYYSSEHRKEDLCFILKKFPNIETLNFMTRQFNKFFYFPTNLIIKDDNNCKINNLFVETGGEITNLIIPCKPFELLNKVKFNFKNTAFYLKIAFPIFSDKCETIFESLKYFSFISEKPDKVYLEALNNIYNNMNCLPNLEEFNLDCVFKEFDNNFYIKVIQKILSLKLRSVIIKIKIGKSKDYVDDLERYSENELREICNNINCINMKEVYIYKLNK